MEIFDIYPASTLATLRKQWLFKKVCGPWKGSLIQTCSRPSGSCWSLAFDCTLPALEATASPVQHGIHLAGHGHLRWEWNALFLSETHSLQSQRGNFSYRCLNRLLALLSLSVACAQMTEFQSKTYYWRGLKIWMSWERPTWKKGVASFLAKYVVKYYRSSLGYITQGACILYQFICLKCNAVILTEILWKFVSTSK